MISFLRKKIYNIFLTSGIFWRELGKCYGKVQRNATQRNATQKLKAFTLIEVIFVFAIIAILLAILLPGMGTIKRSVQKLRDVSHLQKIREAWYEAVVNRGWDCGGNVYCGEYFAWFLAGYDRHSLSDMILNDPHVYISPGDKYASKVEKEAICYMGNNGTIEPYTDPYTFERIQNFMIDPGSSYGALFSYCLISVLPANVPLDTTPFGFTRGLKVNGKWDEKAGLYGSSGGYVIYCDGHVVWFDGSKPAKFLKWDKSGYTNNIRQAVPNNVLLSCSGDGGYCESDDGIEVIISDSGTGES
ncbi:MAG: prepilin-type N-terminal cleavage/methylation domain-containing protein [Puniceicoccales bacterium]|nr:prepilin-type N-terminal cleavage/methylation domain-containing protein [Puniceicoccales bacterium]